MTENFFDKYELYTDEESIYCYPDTIVLKNKFNIKDYNDLKEAEADIVSAKLFELEQFAIKGDFDKKHLYEIHKFLFEDLYDFAGKTRKEDISKGNTKFCVHFYIEDQLDCLFEKINKRKKEVGENKNDKIVFLTYVMAELNIIHPFREGNGRTIREFIKEYAEKLGLRVEWSKISKEDLLNAMIDSVSDTYNLKNSLMKIITLK